MSRIALVDFTTENVDRGLPQLRVSTTISLFLGGCEAVDPLLVPEDTDVPVRPLCTLPEDALCCRELEEFEADVLATGIDGVDTILSGYAPMGVALELLPKDPVPLEGLNKDI